MIYGILTSDSGGPEVVFVARDLDDLRRVVETQFEREGARRSLLRTAETALMMVRGLPLERVSRVSMEVAGMQCGCDRKLYLSVDQAALTTETQTQRLVAALESAVNYIEHSEANRNKLTTAADWQRNVKEFRSFRRTIGIGRSYLDEAAVDLGACRDLLAEHGVRP